MLIFGICRFGLLNLTLKSIFPFDLKTLTSFQQELPFVRSHWYAIPSSLMDTCILHNKIKLKNIQVTDIPGK